MKLNVIYNENCLETIKKLDKNIVDVILTSPFYNTNEKSGRTRTLENMAKSKYYPYARYDVHVDNMTSDEYADFTAELFSGFDNILKKDGCVLYNLSYGGETTDSLIKALYAIVTKTNFELADIITWKKSNAMPNVSSKNKTTRICELIYVFARKNEIKTFNTNKKVVSVKPKTRQKNYDASMKNYVEAKNNDGPCPFNKATYSSDLCKKLLSMYCKAGGIVYDPFMGSGTTAVACKEMGISFIGSEISSNQVQFACERLKNVACENELFEI